LTLTRDQTDCIMQMRE